MKHDFWHSKWQKDEIGFHLAEANPLLVKHFPALQLASNSRIFLPLCGKTLDIHWLLAQGYQVVGAELSTIAVEALFSELNLMPTITQVGRLVQYSAPNITLWNGDIFEINQALLGKVEAVYDRAALVALPEDMRTTYTEHLMALTNKAPQLLICFEYDQSVHAGPPFSIGADEVKQHYQAVYDLTLLASETLADGLKGKYPATEQVWLLKPD
ncbi:MAG: thiopurine S-methyltransferase [Methylotenera sp.]|uniref:thiopurine S-methyltransferase n=1 Tax=Methylotenera sp. TaxID=2051956 RepID=UPI002488839E|nr:thiopurine S-methyltransferase [Methylotenera sp.]MDI1309243.1 thiopurine S-methyltransferase [Methylotenera sp.]